MEQRKKGRKPICCTRAFSSMALVIFGLSMSGFLLKCSIFLSITHLVRQVESQMGLCFQLMQQLGL